MWKYIISWCIVIGIPCANEELKEFEYCINYAIPECQDEMFFNRTHAFLFYNRTIAESKREPFKYGDKITNVSIDSVYITRLK